MRYLHLAIVLILGVSLLVGGCGKSEEDYKKAATAINYEEIVRKPDSFKEKAVFLTGTVQQIKENGKDVELFLMGGNTPIWVSYTLKSNEERIVEGDVVRVWGDFQKISNRKIADALPEINTIDINAKHITRPIWAVLSGFFKINMWSTENNGKKINLSLSIQKVNDNNIDIQGILNVEKEGSYFPFKGTVGDDGVGKYQYVDDKGNSKNIEGTIKITKDGIEINTAQIQQERISKKVVSILESGQYTFAFKK